MSKLALILSTVVIVGALATPASAQVQVNTSSGYGLAGCGLGSVLFGNQPGIIQIIAATTNGVSGNQTFGITSGTSNCVDSAAPVVQVASFIQTNREILAKDAARASGETIDTLGHRLADVDRLFQRCLLANIRWHGLQMAAHQHGLEPAMMLT